MRTWQTAHVMKRRRGALDRRRRGRQQPRAPLRRQVHDLPGDRPRHRPTRSARSRSASSPTSCCGTRASSASARTLVLKGGMIAWAAMGDANASIPTPQPVLPRPMFGADARRGRGHLGAFVAPARARGRAGRPARVCAASSSPWATSARVGKADMPLNDALPRHRGRSRHLHGPHRRRGDRASSRPPSCRWPSATSCSDGRHRGAAAAHAAPTRGFRPAATRTPAGWRRRSTAGLVVDCRRWRPSCAARLRTAGLVDGVDRRRGRTTAGRARPCAAADAEADARTPAPRGAAASRAQGRGLLRAGAARVWPGRRLGCRWAARPHLAVAAVGVGRGRARAATPSRRALSSSTPR